MDVDAARQHVLAGGVDDLVGVNVREARADDSDLLVFDQDVAACTDRTAVTIVPFLISVRASAPSARPCPQNQRLIVTFLSV